MADIEIKVPRSFYLGNAITIGSGICCALGMVWWLSGYYHDQVQWQHGTDTKLSSTESKVDRIDDRIDMIDRRLLSLESKFPSIKQGMLESR